MNKKSIIPGAIVAFAYGLFIGMVGFDITTWQFWVFVVFLILLKVT